MLPISDLSALSLVWKQPSAWRREYLLISDSGTHGRLVIPSMWKEVAKAQCGLEAFTFQRTGFFKRQVLITRQGEHDPMAAYLPDTWRRGGRLDLPGGSTYLFTTNFWQTRFEIKPEGGQPVLVLHKSGLFRMTVQVEVSPAAMQLPELPMLVTLGMYTIHLRQQDAAAASAATSAST